MAKQRAKIWHELHREYNLLRIRKANKRLKNEVYMAYGGYKCACCGEANEKFLSLDHINNNGAEHRKMVDRRKIYYWLKKNNYPFGFQVLCMNCNFGKARNNGICPHIAKPSTTISKEITTQANGVGSAEHQFKLVEDIVYSA